MNPHDPITEAEAKELEAFTVDDLAQEIRRVDGSHALGAGALADALVPFLSLRIAKALIDRTPAPAAVAPGHTDLMLSPEAIDAFLATCDLSEITAPAAVEGSSSGEGAFEARAVMLVKKHGNPVGTDYEQGQNDMGHRMVTLARQADLAIAALQPSSAAPESSGEEVPCGGCGQSSRYWHARSGLWNKVMGGPDATDDPGGILCPNCFIDKAASQGDTRRWIVTDIDPDQPSSAADAKPVAHGWLFQSDDGLEWSLEHPIESGGSQYAEEIRAATPELLVEQMQLAWQDLAAQPQPSEQAGAEGEVTYSQAEFDECGRIGERDGYESAIQDLDLATGGDGEFRGSTDPSRRVDVEAMKARIIERIAALKTGEAG